MISKTLPIGYELYLDRTQLLQDVEIIYQLDFNQKMEENSHIIDIYNNNRDCSVFMTPRHTIFYISDKFDSMLSVFAVGIEYKQSLPRETGNDKDSLNNNDYNVIEESLDHLLTT